MKTKKKTYEERREALGGRVEPRFTVQDAANYLGLHPETIRKFARLNKIPVSGRAGFSGRPRKVKRDKVSSGAYRFTKSGLDSWMERNGRLETKP